MEAGVAARLSEIRLISAFLESIFYGMYITTCFECFAILLHLAGGSRHRNYDLHRKRNDRIWTRVRWGMLSIASILVVFSSLHLALVLYQILKAFLGDASLSGTEPLVVFGDITSWDNMVTVWHTHRYSDLHSYYFLISVCPQHLPMHDWRCYPSESFSSPRRLFKNKSLVSEIYRVYILYDHSWKMIVPSFLLLVHSSVASTSFTSKVHSRRLFSMRPSSHQWGQHFGE
jgi:hypothetical protein